VIRGKNEADPYCFRISPTYYSSKKVVPKKDLWKMPPFAQSLCQAQISILEIFNIFLWLKFSPSLTLNKIEHFSKVSKIAITGGNIEKIELPRP
jgi:hypothetical protein